MKGKGDHEGVKGRIGGGDLTGTKKIDTPEQIVRTRKRLWTTEVVTQNSQKGGGSTR